MSDEKVKSNKAGKKPETKKKFRYVKLSFGLTYSRCDLSKEEVLSHVEVHWKPLEEYYIVRETHKDGGFHIHMYGKFMGKPNIKNARYWDIPKPDGSGVYHPNVVKANKSWCHNYLSKQDKEPLTNMDNGFITLAKEGKLEEAEALFASMYPRDYIINLNRVRKHLSVLGKRKHEEKVFLFTGEEVSGWNWQTHSLLICAESGVGKTNWAKSWCGHKKLSWYKVTHMDDLKRYNGEDIIIWDDIQFAHFPITTQIHICTVMESRSIHCRNVAPHISAGVGNIFLCNPGRLPFSFTLDENGEEVFDPAISRRLVRAPLLRFY